MQNLKAKLKKQGGFTLIEMLIVVAIIAILIAIAIPMVNNALEAAREAVDDANERAAKSEALLYYMGVVDDATLNNFDNAYVPGAQLVARYDAKNGKLVGSSGTVTAYGQCTGRDSCYAGATTHVGKVIQVTVETTGEVKVEWETVS